MRAPQARRDDRPQQLARDVLARAARRGRDPAGRVAYGPVDEADVASLLDAGCSKAAPMRCASGRPSDPLLAKQER
jgi:hypothetical protein